MFGLSHEKLYEALMLKYSDQLYEEIRMAEQTYEQKGLVFRNTPFPLYPRVLVVDAALRNKALQDAEALLTILEKVIQLYEHDEATQKFFMLDEIAQELVQIDPGYNRRIRISRFDTFLTGDETPFKVLENNTDCPAGVIFTGYIMQFMRQVPTLSKFLEQFSLVNEAIESSLAFVSELLSAYQEFCGTNTTTPRIAILQPRGRISSETREMISIFARLGIAAVIADPRDLDYRNCHLFANNQQIDLIWNKINTAQFIPLLSDTSAMEPLLQACRERAVCHVNSFQSRYITESKLCLAYLVNQDFRHHFTAIEQQLLNRLLPWSRKLDNSVTQYHGEEMEVRRLAYKYQNSLVLKAAYDIRGDGVVIGRSVSQEQWQEIVNACWGKPFILQEFVSPPKVPVLIQKKSEFVFKNFSLDMFMFGGKFQGFGSKISDFDKLNLFQGGSKQAVFSVT